MDKIREGYENYFSSWRYNSQCENTTNGEGDQENSASQRNNGSRTCLDGNDTVEWLDVNRFCAECSLGAINSGYTMAECLVRSAESVSLTGKLTW